MRGGFQPYARRQPRQAGPALTAMSSGRPAFLSNPMDARRQMQRRHSPGHPGPMRPGGLGGTNAGSVGDASRGAIGVPNTNGKGGPAGAIGPRQPHMLDRGPFQGGEVLGNLGVNRSARLERERINRFLQSLSAGRATFAR